MRKDDKAIDILVVDDEPSICHVVARSLSSMNSSVRVAVAHTGREALEALKGYYFNLCFLDIGLPDLSGLKVMERILATNASTKVVVMTASPLTEAMKRRIKEEAWAFIEKPFRLLDIRQIVKDALMRMTPTEVNRSIFHGHAGEVVKDDS